MIKCKGCDEQIDYWPLARVKVERATDFYSAGPALTHTGELCAWFRHTRAVEIIAYIENMKLTTRGVTLSPETTTAVKGAQESMAKLRAMPLPGLASK